MTRFLLLLCAAFLLAGCGAKGEPLQATVAAVYECYGLACKLTVRDSRAIPRVGEGELPPTDVHDALPGMEGVTEPPKPDSTPRSGLQERSL